MQAVSCAPAGRRCVALAATLAYAVVVIGFGLDFRPLHNDEGVTLGVASRASAIDVLRVAVDHRHGPPLHYLLVHASLAWRYDILGAAAARRRCSASSAVALSYGFGRELLGRARRRRRRGRHRLLADHDPPGPVRARLHRDDRRRPTRAPGCMLVLVRTGRARWVVPYALAALMLVVGAPVRAVRAPLRARADGGVRGGAPAPRPARPAPAGGAPWSRRSVLGGLALVLLRHLYSPLQSKYGVGSGSPVIELGSRRVLGAARRRRVRLAPTSASRSRWPSPRCSASPRSGVRNRRAAVVRGGVAGAAAGAALGAHGGVERLRPRAPPVVPAAGLRRRARGLRARAAPPRRRALRRLVAAAVVAALLAPGWVADHNELANFNANLRDASLYMAGRFGHDGRARDDRRHALAGRRTRASSAPTPCWPRRTPHRSRAGSTSARCAAASWCAGSTSAARSARCG